MAWPNPYDKRGCTDHMPRKPCTHELHWARHAVRLPAQVAPSSSTEGIVTIAATCHDLVGSAGSYAAPSAAAERGSESSAHDAEAHAEGCRDAKAHALPCAGSSG